MDKNVVSQHLQDLEGKFSRWGLDACLVAGRAEIETMMCSVGKEAVHPVSEIEPRQIDQGQAFWLTLKRGDLHIACIAARFIHLTPMGFECYWRELCAGKYPNQKCPVGSVSEDIQRALHGKIVYFGGVQVAKSEQGSISKLGAFIEYAKLISMRMWSFDKIYTIINTEHRPLARVYRFGSIFEAAVRWTSPPPDGLSNDQLYLVEGRSEFENRLAPQPG
ncbi:hypothetical protein [Phaeobacter sp. C3_T13_0]|uniref:hypothetical protein n=1 Tax=Phaeobacter cretensis TaxID=3342641 RepID=UPI0039BD0984